MPNLSYNNITNKWCEVDSCYFPFRLKPRSQIFAVGIRFFLHNLVNLMRSQSALFTYTLSTCTRLTKPGSNCWLHYLTKVSELIQNKRVWNRRSKKKRRTLLERKVRCAFDQNCKHSITPQLKAGAWKKLSFRTSRDDGILKRLQFLFRTAAKKWRKKR